MKPKFEVGETVILQSKDCPEYNGEYIIENILTIGDTYYNRLNGEYYYIEKNLGGFTYLFTEPLQDPYCFEESEAIWSESALRKKYKPSELSFDALMSTLKSPISREDLIK